MFSNTEWFKLSKSLFFHFRFPRSSFLASSCWAGCPVLRHPQFAMRRGVVARRFRHIYAHARPTTSAGQNKISWYIKLSKTQEDVEQHLSRKSYDSEEAALQALLQAFRAAGSKTTARQLSLQTAPPQKTVRGFNKYRGLVQTGSGRYRVRTPAGMVYCRSERAAIKVLQVFKRPGTSLKVPTRKAPGAVSKVFFI